MSDEDTVRISHVSSVESRISVLIRDGSEMQKEFLRNGGWNLLHDWIQHCRAAQNGTLFSLIINFIAGLPTTSVLDMLKQSNTPMIPLLESIVREKGQVSETTLRSEEQQLCVDLLVQWHALIAHALMISTEKGGNVEKGMNLIDSAITIVCLDGEVTLQPTEAKIWWVMTRNGESSCVKMKEEDWKELGALKGAFSSSEKDLFENSGFPLPTTATTTETGKRDYPNPAPYSFSSSFSSTSSPSASQASSENRPSTSTQNAGWIKATNQDIPKESHGQNTFEKKECEDTTLTKLVCIFKKRMNERNESSKKCKMLQNSEIHTAGLNKMNVSGQVENEASAGSPMHQPPQPSPTVETVELLRGKDDSEKPTATLVNAAVTGNQNTMNENDEIATLEDTLIPWKLYKIYCDDQNSSKPKIRFKSYEEKTQKYRELYIRQIRSPPEPMEFVNAKSASEPELDCDCRPTRTMESVPKIRTCDMQNWTNVCDRSMEPWPKPKTEENAVVVNSFHTHQPLSARKKHRKEKENPYNGSKYKYVRIPILSTTAVAPLPTPDITSTSPSPNQTSTSYVTTAVWPPLPPDNPSTFIPQPPPPPPPPQQPLLPLPVSSPPTGPPTYLCSKEKSSASTAQEFSEDPKLTKITPAAPPQVSSSFLPSHSSSSAQYGSTLNWSQYPGHHPFPPSLLGPIPRPMMTQSLRFPFHGMQTQNMNPFVLPPRPPWQMENQFGYPQLPDHFSRENSWRF